MKMATLTLNIPDTTFVSSYLPDMNFSSYPLVYSGTDPSFQNCISFLQIVLPVLPVTSVDSALLELSVIVKSGAAPSPLVVNRVTDPFSTATVTYNTRPAFTATPSGIDITTEDLYTTVQIDVTTLINDWLNGAYSNNGIALTNSDGTSVVAVATNSINYEPFDPRLVLTYTPVKPDTALCFSYAQLAHLIEQLITLYPTNTMSVFLTGFSPSAITGTPYQLYVSPEGTYGMIFILLDNGQQEAIPLNAIAAIYTGDGTVYDPSITYLPPPQFPDGCDKNLITAYHDYVPVSTDVQMYLGSIVQASGLVYKNEYGILVLSDADGNTPVFIPVMNITSIFPVTQNSSGQKTALPRITITNKT
ncbi:MAG: DNRLRE domain-containing protein [Dehalobacter sp. 4CP]|nr:DNRLRE domain-containing protein [Dehalobacter sp. 4CP]